MSDTVKRIYDLIDAQTLVPSNYIAQHRDNPSARLHEDLRLDSLDMLDVQFAVEEAFLIDLPDDVPAPGTVGDLAALIDEHVRLKNARAS